MKNSMAVALSGATTALAAVRGFNYAAQGQTQASFEASFKTAAALEGADDFTSARLYTMIQEGTANSPISAIQAAIDTQTTLLLGLWASSPQATFDNEITALKNAIEQHGSDFAGLVQGISVGSEDLYRISETGLANDPLGVGQTPDVLIDYITQVRDAIAGTALSSVPVGHVDTWNAFVNGSNSAVISACDFLGLDEYPYFQTTDENTIDNAKDLFFEAYDKVAAVAEGAQIWVTEAGWPTSGPESGLAVASVDDAEIFWQDVACELQTRGIDFWWYILEDAGASPAFGVSEGGKPLYNLACNATSGSSYNSTSSSSVSGTHTSTPGYHNATASSTKTATGTATSIVDATATATGSDSDSVSASGTNSASPPGVSSYSSGAGKTEGAFAAIVLAAVMAALTL